ncbi:hypothetical protein [Herminiimonas fonticola]|uniref:hypothetical protein n=1 Tax=Herminiimonas fonticola TaxID=303380 RepID=UPI003341A946
MFFKHDTTPDLPPTHDIEPEPRQENISKKPVRHVENILLESPLYRFKRDVLSLVAKMNQGVPNMDCEMLKKQTMFIQSQLLHSLTNDPTVPGNFKIMLMEYHAKSVRATLIDRRGEHSRHESEK